MSRDDEQSVALAFAGWRARDFASKLTELLSGSDIPPSHWDEVVEWFSQLAIEEAEKRVQGREE